MGDAFLAIFRLEEGVDVCRLALDAADEAFARVRDLNERRAAEGRPTTEVYLSLHLGDVLYGNIGSRDRLDFTVVGPAVNEASRIADMASSLEQAVLVSTTFAEAAQECSDRLVSVGRYALRGIRRPQELFALVAPEDAEAAAPPEVSR